MKKIIKKLSLTFLVLFSILYTTVYGNMTIEAMEESAKFYNEHKFFIDSTRVISAIMELAFFVFIIIIPIIIIFKKVKSKNSQDEKNKYIIKTLGIAELLFIINIFITNMTKVARYGSKSILYVNIFIIVISLLNIGIVLFKLLKKNKN